MTGCPVGRYNKEHNNPTPTHAQNKVEGRPIDCHCGTKETELKAVTARSAETVCSVVTAPENATFYGSARAFCPLRGHQRCIRNGPRSVAPVTRASSRRSGPTRTGYGGNARVRQRVVHAGACIERSVDILAANTPPLDSPSNRRATSRMQSCQ